MWRYGGVASSSVAMVMWRCLNAPSGNVKEDEEGKRRRGENEKRVESIV